MLKHINLLIYRIMHDKVFLITYLVLIPIVMSIAVYLTNTISYHMNIAVVGDIEVVENEYLSYTYIDEVPPASKLVLNQFDAIIEQENNIYKVTSTKGEEFNEALPYIIQGQLDIKDDSTKRGAATNILGFLMMIISLLGVQLYSYYFDERHGINKRILSTSMTCQKYMLSHFIVVLGFLFIPACIVISAAVWLLNIPIAMPLWQLNATLFLLCFFSTAFGLWINSLSKSIEESMMFGNMFAISASIVSGGFVAVTDNDIFNQIIQVLPQKHLMSLLTALENHTSLPIIGILYIIVISIFLILFAIRIEKRKLSTR